MSVSTNGQIHATIAALVETSQPHTVPSSPASEPLRRVLWQAWKDYSHRASGYQGQVLLSLVYFFVLGPSALVGRLFGTSLLDLRVKPRSSYWIERAPAEKTLASLTRQF